MNNYPNTFRAVDSTRDAGRPQVFEPALLHFRRAFRLGDFLSPSLHERLEWERTRAQVRTHLLRLVAESRWSEHLVLRGSVLMQAWFGERARDPKDIDWVFQPQNVKLGDALCEECFAELVELVKANPTTADAEILVSQIASDDIWTYERAAGRRLVFPFQSELGQREIQMDIVWAEKLFEPPTKTSLSVPQEEPITVLAATPALSLAWKLLWLITDIHAQGKDLYDAVLLAQNTKLSLELLSRVLNSDEWVRQYRKITPDLLEEISADWPNFKLEYLWIEGEEKQWLLALKQALAPTWNS